MGQSKLLEGPPYLSFKELKYEGARILFSPATERLYWELDGVFPTAISVMKTPRGANDLEPFFRPDTGTWHEISQLPLTEPKVSSLEVSVYDLGQWEYDWAEYHECHCGQWESDWAEYYKHHGGDTPKGGGQEWVTYGDLDDDVRPYAKEQKEDGSWEEDSDTEFLIKCCGEDRPLRKADLKLVVTAGSESFVTVRNFVSVVHPWLMSLRGDIFKAKSVSRSRLYYNSPPELNKWMVAMNTHCAGQLEIELKKDWVQRHTPYTPRPLGDLSGLTPSLAAHLAQRRAMRNEGGIPPV